MVRFVCSLNSGLQEETGHDVAKDYAVNAVTGLSAVACCYPACDLFWVIPREYPVRKQKALVHEHLRMCCSVMVPGFHQTVRMHRNLPVDEVAALIAEGTELKPLWPPRKSSLKADARDSLENKIANGMPKEALKLFLEENVRLLKMQPSFSYDEFKAIMDARYIAL